MIRYIQHRNPYDLQELVNKELASGWHLHGPLITRTSQGLTDFGQYLTDTKDPDPLAAVVDAAADRISDRVSELLLAIQTDLRSMI